jgi:hypothetical protein
MGLDISSVSSRLPLLPSLVVDVIGAEWYDAGFELDDEEQSEVGDDNEEQEDGKYRQKNRRSCRISSRDKEIVD